MPLSPIIKKGNTWSQQVVPVPGESKGDDSSNLPHRTTIATVFKELLLLLFGTLVVIGLFIANFLYASSRVVMRFFSTLCCMKGDYSSTVLLVSYNGMFLTSSNLHDKDISMEICKHHFLGHYTFISTREKYREILNKLRFLDIFAYKHDDPNLKTVIHRKNSDKPVQVDDLVSVTTRLVGGLYMTSYEKVSILEETENLFIMCMTTCSENCVNGYYRIKVDFEESSSSITIEYAKVQSLAPLLLRLALDNGVTDNGRYRKGNMESVANTINFLTGNRDFNVEKVVYKYH